MTSTLGIDPAGTHFSNLPSRLGRRDVRVSKVDHTPCSAFFAKAAVLSPKINMSIDSSPSLTPQTLPLERFKYTKNSSLENPVHWMCSFATCNGIVIVAEPLMVRKI